MALSNVAPFVRLNADMEN